MDNNFYNSNDENTYKFVNPKNKNNFSFSKNVLIPFVSGILGSCIVVGAVFCFPNIRGSLISKNENTLVSSTVDNNSNNYQNVENTQLTSAVSLKNYSDTAIGVAKKVLPSIVGIEVEFPVTSSFYRMNSTTTSSGSGIIISEDGYILTNNHIISSSSSNTSFYYSLGEASSVKVYLYEDDTPYEASIVGSDEKTDLAVLKIEKNGLVAAELGNSDNINVGEFAMAIGNPIGLQSSVTCGVISALNRNIKTSDATYTVIQTDAAINSGNSGGALVNSEGKVIGVNTLKVSSTGVEGIGFAIPINSTKDIYSQLIASGKVKRPYIGITGQNIDEATAQKHNLVVGVYIREVKDFSPAQKAGLKVGDVITSVNNISISTVDKLTDLISSLNIGDTVTVSYYRDGDIKNVNITLEEEN